MSGITYSEAGVDIDAGEELVDRIKPAVKKTMRKEVLSSVGGFASMVELPKGYREPLLVSGTDGVGTKLKIAFALNNHRTVGIDLVAMCANDILATGAEPLFFLDYYACSKLSPEGAADVVEGIAQGCCLAGAALVGGETAELPGFYKEDEYDLAGFMVGVVEKQNVIDGSGVKAGDVLLGLASSGLHSNGYSLARKVIEKSKVSLKERLDGCDMTLGEALLEPTRVYCKPVLAAAAEVELKAIAHITGGGLIENIPRTLPEGLGVQIDENFDRPPIFDWIARNGPVDRMECFRTFNMGIGMTLVVSEDQAKKAFEILTREGEKVYSLGRVTEVEQGAPSVVIRVS